jgi:hypothetical protein
LLIAYTALAHDAVLVTDDQALQLETFTASPSRTGWSTELDRFVFLFFRRIYST